MKYANRKDKCLMYFGWLFAVLSGAILPCFIFMLGPIFDSFGPSNDAKETLEMVKVVVSIMGILAFAIAITGFM